MRVLYLMTMKTTRNAWLIFATVRMNLRLPWVADEDVETCGALFESEKREPDEERETRKDKADGRIIGKEKNAMNGQR